MWLHMKEQVADQPDLSPHRAKNTGARMNGKFRRHAAIASVAALGVGGLVLGIGGAASASARITVGASSPVFNGTSVASGQTGIPVLQPGDTLIATCWTRGQNLGSGNVWYRTVEEFYTKTGQELNVNGWTYGGSVDSNEAFHQGAVQGC